MKLSISNIAWTAEEDEKMYALMHRYGYSGLEIAPTHFFAEPYRDLESVKKWRQESFAKEGFVISSMQSIWYGRTEALFANAVQRKALFAYTQKAIDFAEAIQCTNLVFGSPKNRVIPNPDNKQLWQQGVQFFREIGDYAYTKQAVIAMEANPPIYNTNYINTTKEAIALIEEVASEGFQLNLDLGTMIEAKESVDVLEGCEKRIHHVHLSEPFLRPIVIDSSRRQFHREIAAFLREKEYQGYVSVEMGKTQEGIDRISLLEEILAYGREIFG
ncbi:hypothetical protein IMSAGC011_00301 [Lachnospiraceae bacterium]|nr:hypothetical protein IMSAGC011_00301 [Lachnospiraceae bacterium]